MIEGTLVIDTADGKRTCVCGKKILKGEKHLARYRSNGSWTPTRKNYCRQCTVGELIKVRAEIEKMERTMYGEDGA